jgi:hypothetical protein
MGAFDLSTGQKFHQELEVCKLFMEVKDDISQEVKSMPKEAFEGA